MSLHRTRRDALGEPGPPEVLEVEADRGRDCAWGYIVCAAERGQKVVQYVVIRQVDEVHLRAPLVPIGLEQVVISDRQVEEVPCPNARRVVVVILGSRRWYLGE